MKKLFVILSGSSEMLMATIGAFSYMFGHLIGMFTVDLSIYFFLASFLIGGYHKAKQGITDTIEEHRLNVEVLMIIAAIGAILIGHVEDGALLIFIFSISGALETYVNNKSQQELSKLIEMRPRIALKKVGNEQQEVAVESLEIGDIIVIRAYEIVPVDVKILSSEAQVDNSTITGEAEIIEVEQGDSILSGAINLGKVIEAKVEHISQDSMFQKIVELIENTDSQKTPEQKKIEKYEGIYVYGVLALSLLIMVIFPLLGFTFEESFYKAMLVLVVASPCAVVASITPATLAAISYGAKKGIIIKGGNILQKLSTVQNIGFDKTGTLTEGIHQVQKFHHYPKISSDYFLSIVHAIETNSTHPLAKSICEYTTSFELTSFMTENVQELPGKGISAQIGGITYYVGNANLVGPELVYEYCQNYNLNFEDEGFSIMYVAIDSELIGVIALSDIVRSEVLEVIPELEKRKITPIMLTGDNLKNAEKIASQVGIKDFHAALTPVQKVEKVQALRANGVLMVGDGINDAPALANATVSVAMGSGSGVALDTADIVLMNTNFMNVIEVIDISRKLTKIIKQNIIFAFTIIFTLLITNVFIVDKMPIILAVIGHEGSTIFVILNGLRLLKSPR